MVKVSVRTYDEVLWLDVSMDEAVLVEYFESREHLIGDVHGGCEGESLAALLKDAVEIPTETAHHDVVVLIVFPVGDHPRKA